jgi:hypothetical protein
MELKAGRRWLPAVVALLPMKPARFVWLVLALLAAARFFRYTPLPGPQGIPVVVDRWTGTACFASECYLMGHNLGDDAQPPSAP